MSGPEESAFSEIREEPGAAAGPVVVPVAVRLSAVVVAVTDEVPRILAVGAPARSQRAGEPRDALPHGPFDPLHDRTLELGLRRWIAHQTGIEVGYVEQLYTFGDRDREAATGGTSRIVSVAYLALVQEQEFPEGAAAYWSDWYDFFPWEDWRRDRPQMVEEVIAPALLRWAAAAEGDLRRRERIDITFGLEGAPWDEERVLERYELLYEVGLVEEAQRDRGVVAAARLGRPMAFDHRRIAATALGRLRGKLKYRPLVFELLPDAFTLLQLQRVVEALAGTRLHKQNFRRLVERGGLVEGTGRREAHTGGRPAELFRFRREVLRERPAPGVGLPAARRH